MAAHPFDHLQDQVYIFEVGQDTTQFMPSPRPQRFAEGVVYIATHEADPQVAITGQVHNSLQVLGLYLHCQAVAQVSELRE